jgi:hypothetical protein
MNAKCRLVSLLCIVTWFPVQKETHAQSREFSLSEIQANHKLYSQRIQSLRARFMAENTSTAALKRVQPTAVYSERMKVDYLCKGVKYRWNNQPADPGANRGDTLFDGKATYLLWYERTPGTGIPRIVSATKRGKQFGTPPHVLSFGYQVEGVHSSPWIGDLLQAGTFQLLGIEESARSRFGTLCLVRGVLNDDEITFWFAPKFGFIAVRTEVRPTSEKGYRSTYEIMELLRVNDLWFAKKAVRKMSFYPSGKLHLRYKINVDDVTLNSVPDATFELNLPPRRTLYDQDKDVRYIIGANGEQSEDQVYTNSRRFSLSLMRNWLFIASLTSLLILGMRATVQWHQRHRSA